MAKGLWWVTRPTRDLHDLGEALTCFASIARDQKWRGNRDLHRRFEEENPAKTPHAGSYGANGSGGRTWAAWLKMWGMWYDDDSVKMTDGADLIISARDPEIVHKQIVHMIMSFQITGAYHNSLGYGRGFKIFPFRFMLRLLLNPQIKFLSTDEIGLFLLQVKTPEEYEKVVNKITEWRSKTGDPETKKKLMKRLILSHMKKYHRPRKDSPTNIEGYWRSIKDIANTLAINISYISELVYDNRKSIVTIDDNEMGNVEKLLRKYDTIGFSTLYEYSETAFYRRAGIRYDRRKASAKETRPVTPASKKIKHITNSILELKRKNKIKDGKKLIDQIKKMTGYNANTITRVLKDNPDMLPASTGNLEKEFVGYYLKCAVAGDEHAEFENLTRMIFSKLGFMTKKRKIPKQSSNLEIDGLILNPEAELSGLLECKSGSKYTFTVGDCDKMIHSYIPEFRRKRIDGKTYSLDFFVYVIGCKAGGLNNMKEIIEKSGIRGSVICARDLLNLYGLVKDGKIGPVKMWGLFKCNKNITWIDIESLAESP